MTQNNPTSELNRVLRDKVLRTRARRLARPLLNDEQKNRAYQVVVAFIGGGKFGFETAYVQGAYKLKSVTPVPGLGAPFIGLTNIRGEILTLIDPPSLFGSDAGVGFGERSKYALVIAFEGHKLALAIEELVGVKDVDELELVSEFSGLTGRLSGFTLAVTNEMLIILDSKKFFEHDTISEEILYS